MSTETLRTVEWARRQLGLKHVRSARRWLASNGVTVKRGRLLDSAFWAIWGARQPVDPEAIAEEALRS